MTGSVFVCRLIIPYGKGKAILTPLEEHNENMYQFPMGKVKRTLITVLISWKRINSLWER